MLISLRILPGAGLWGKLQECPASRDNKALQIDTSAEGHPRVVTENPGDSALQSLGFCLHCVILPFSF